MLSSGNSIVSGTRSLETYRETVAGPLTRSYAAKNQRRSLTDVPAEVEAVVGSRIARTAHAGQVRIDSRHEHALGLQRIRVVIDEPVAVKGVSAGLGDDIDDAAERPAILGLIAARLDLDLLDELVVDRLALNAFQDVRRVDAVDDPLVLGRGRTVDR